MWGVTVFVEGGDGIIHLFDLPPVEGDSFRHVSGRTAIVETMERTYPIPGNEGVVCLNAYCRFAD